MKAKQIKRALASAGLSLLTAIVSMILVFALGGLLEPIFPLGEDIGAGLLHIIWAIIIAVACYYICRSNPRSIWYVPILCNMIGIISVIVELKFWITIFVCGQLALSIIAAIRGAKAGKRFMSDAS